MRRFGKMKSFAALAAAFACIAAVAEPCPVSRNVRGHENIEWSISYAYGLVDRTRHLPRVLLVGDSICNAYQGAVRNRLKGKMNVTYWVSSYCVTSPAYLRLLSVYLDEADYDVVHFNNGLHSLGTDNAAYQEGYRAALELIRRRQPNASIVWCSSTPLRDAARTKKCRELNAAAARAVAEVGGIAMNDLFAFCDGFDRAKDWNDIFHFRRHAVARQAERVATSVLSALNAARRRSTVRVGSYNIRLMPGDRGTPNAWNERKDGLVNEIRRLGMDVFGMQEVFPEQAFYITNALPQYAVVGEYRNADRISGEASPVCYLKDRFSVVTNGTFWLSETPDVPGVKGWGAACPRVCTWALLEDRRTGVRFTFANTHTDHISARARKEGMLLVIRRMRAFAPKGTPIIFTGDHNCRETEEPAIAVSELLNDAIYVSKTPPRGPWRTFNGWSWREQEVSAVDAMKLPKDVRNARIGSPDAEKQDGRHRWEDCGARIDYIYVSKDVTVNSFATYAEPRAGTKLYPSDHNPVTAEIVLPAAKR